MSDPLSIVRKHSRRADRVKNLDCFDQVVVKIKDGESLSSIAKFIQEDQGQCLDIKRSTLITHLQHIRDDMGKSELISQRMPLKFMRVWNEIEGIIYELKEIKRLYLLQKKRVKKFADTEQTLPVPVPGLGDEIDKLLRILTTLVDKKMDLGLVERNIGRLRVNQLSEQSINIIEDVSERFRSPEVVKMIVNDKSRERVLKFVGKVLQNVKQEGRDDDSIREG